MSRSRSPRSRRPSTARRRRDSGAATTELVIATPVLLFMIMLLVQTGLWYHTKHIAQAAAQEGSHAARVEGGSAGDGSAAANVVLDDLAPTLLQNRVVSSERTTESARVDVSGDAQNVIPFMTFHISETAESPVERFRAP